MYVVCFDYGVDQDNLQRFLLIEFVLQIYFWMVNEVLNELGIILWVLTAGGFLLLQHWYSINFNKIQTNNKKSSTNPRTARE